MASIKHRLFTNPQGEEYGYQIFEKYVYSISIIVSSDLHPVTPQNMSTFLFAANATQSTEYPVVVESPRTAAVPAGTTISQYASNVLGYSSEYDSYG